MAASELAERTAHGGKEPPVLEETYGNTAIKNRFLVVGETVRKSTQRNVGPPLHKFLKVDLGIIFDHS